MYNQYKVLLEFSNVIFRQAFYSSTVRRKRFESQIQQPGNYECLTFVYFAIGAISDNISSNSNYLPI